MNCSNTLKWDMQLLAEKHCLDRVEVSIRQHETAPDGKTQVLAQRAVLFIPGLGWTMKDDVANKSWGEAKVVGTV